MIACVVHRAFESTSFKRQICAYRLVKLAFSMHYALLNNALTHAQVRRLQRTHFQCCWTIATRDRRNENRASIRTTKIVATAITLDVALFTTNVTMRPKSYRALMCVWVWECSPICVFQFDRRANLWHFRHTEHPSTWLQFSLEIIQKTVAEYSRESVYQFIQVRIKSWENLFPFRMHCECGNNW